MSSNFLAILVIALHLHSLLCLPPLFPERPLLCFFASQPHPPVLLASPTHHCFHCQPLPSSSRLDVGLALEHACFVYARITEKYTHTSCSFCLHSISDAGHRQQTDTFIRVPLMTLILQGCFCRTSYAQS